MVSLWINQPTNNSSRLVDPLRLIPPTFYAKCLSLLPGYSQPLSSLPQCLTADTEFFCQFCLGHAFLMLQDELPEIVFQRKIFRWGGSSLGGHRDVDGKQIRCDEIVLTQDYCSFDCVLQFPDIEFGVRVKTLLISTNVQQ